jgi:hypothetical protein
VKQAKNYIILFVVMTGYSHGQCDNAVTLSYISERLVGNAISDEATPICDYFLDEGWYSMGKYVLADNSDPCQTTYNWYMTGKSFYCYKPALKQKQPK